MGFSIYFLILHVSLFPCLKMNCFFNAYKSCESSVKNGFYGVVVFFSFFCWKPKNSFHQKYFFGGRGETRGRLRGPVTDVGYLIYHFLAPFPFSPLQSKGRNFRLPVKTFFPFEIWKKVSLDYIRLQLQKGFFFFASFFLFVFFTSIVTFIRTVSSALYLLVNACLID